MKTTVVKFGGSSLADASQIKKASEIIKSDPSRRFAVASAPGKRNGSDIKVTDLLYGCCDKKAAGEDYSENLNEIKLRYSEITKGLGISFDIDSEIEEIASKLRCGGEYIRDYTASRGEYLNSKIIAAYLGFTFVDAAEIVRFNTDGSFDDEATDRLISERLGRADGCFLIPGFYGADENGTVHTFSRGGSDITGSLIARGVFADVYENWTDVSGLLTADPHIVESPDVIDYISYSELRELAYMGASVMHEDAIFPVRRAGIPINIRNTNRPEDPGTMIVAVSPKNRRPVVLTGIAGKKGFCAIQVEKSMMNSEVGFGAKLLDILADHGIPFEHCPTGIDTMSVVVQNSDFKPREAEVLAEIEEKLSPEVLLVENSLAMLAVVGQGIAYTYGVAAAVFKELADSKIDIRMIDQGSSGLNIIIGVDESSYEDAVRACYRVLKSF